MKTKMMIIFLWLLLPALACRAGASTPDIEPTMPASVPEVADNNPTPTEAPTDTPAPTTTPTAPPPTETPAPTATATNTPIPPTPTPEPEPTLLDFGFGQVEQNFGYGLIVTNFSANFAYRDNSYRVDLLDEDGDILDTTERSFEIIYPNETAHFGGSVFLDEGQEVASIDVALILGDPMEVMVKKVPAFTVTSPTFYERENTNANSVRGIVTNPYDNLLEIVPIHAVAFNTAGEIVGGGSNTLNFIHPNEARGAEFAIYNVEEVARVEIYPHLSWSNYRTVTGEREAEVDTEELSITSFGFTQTDSNFVYFGLVAENLNSTSMMDSPRYHLTTYDADGAILDVAEGRLRDLLPNQQMGYSSFFTVDDDTRADFMDIQVWADDLVDPEFPLPFTTDEVTIDIGDFSSTVTGFVTNPYDSNVTDLEVTAILYDEAGSIIGSGSKFLDLATANGQTIVEVTIWELGGMPASIELYATLSSFSDFEE